MAGALRLNANSRPGSARVTVGVFRHAGPRRPLLAALKRAPTTGPVDPLVHVQRTHSGLHSPIRVMSETSEYTSFGEAAISVETVSCGIRLDIGWCSSACLPLIGGLTASLLRIRPALAQKRGFTPKKERSFLQP